MSDLEKSIKIITYFGIIPFYVTPVASLFSVDFFINKFVTIENFSKLYCALIVSFLSGMQWHKLITQKNKKLLIVPLIPLFTVLFYDNEIIKSFSSLFFIFALLISLSIDLIIYKNSTNGWFRKLRINATIFASLSFLI